MNGCAGPTRLPPFLFVKSGTGNNETDVDKRQKIWLEIKSRKMTYHVASPENITAKLQSSFFCSFNLSSYKEVAILKVHPFFSYLEFAWDAAPVGCATCNHNCNSEHVFKLIKTLITCLPATPTKKESGSVAGKLWFSMLCYIKTCTATLYWAAWGMLAFWTRSCF